MDHVTSPGEPKGLFDEVLDDEEEDQQQQHQNGPHQQEPVFFGNEPTHAPVATVIGTTPAPVSPIFPVSSPLPATTAGAGMTSPTTTTSSNTVVSPTMMTSPTAMTSPSSTPDEPIDVEPKLSISISGYDKRGEGMNSYVVYKVITKSNLGQVVGFTKKEYDVWRRFSDFLGLHDKLIEKHLPNGCIVPQAPEKDVIGTTKIKMSKTVEDDAGANEFLERRRASLERFLRRCSLHPTLMLDPDFRDFLTLEADLPKSSQTSALSGTTVMRLLGRVGDTFSKMTVRVDDGDTWFQDKQFEIEELDDLLKKLHAAVENLIYQRKELSVSIDTFCKSLSLLAACEDNTSLSKALSVLSEILEKISALHQDQADKDLFILGEALKDYLGLIASIRDIFQERLKAWQSWQNAQLNLAKKRENKTRYELAGKSDNLPAAKKEVQECEIKVQECEDNFDKLNRIMRKELRRFDVQRVHDFKVTLLQYLETLSSVQQQLIKYWETFIPDAKGIVVA